MTHRAWIQKIEAWHDGESADTEAVQAHLAECPACQKHLDWLRQQRAALRGADDLRPIEDAQFNAFYDTIRDRLDPPRSHRRGFLAAASFTLAALIIAVSAFSIFYGPAPVKATEVESASTELEGATIDWYSNEDGVTTVQLTLPEDDVW